MSANIEGMVREGINAFKAGRKEEARALLSKAVELDPYHEEGWLWLSGVVTSVEDQRTCLENVLAINPANARARSGLDYLIRQSGGTPPAPPAPAARAAAPSPARAAPPAAPAPPAVTTSVEWGAGEAEADFEGGWHAAQPPSSDNYDEWVAGLQLRDTEPVPSPRLDPYAPINPASPFTDAADFGAEDEAPVVDEEPDLFAPASAFAARAASTTSAPLSYQMPPLDDDEYDAPVEPARPVAPPPRIKTAAPVNLADVPLDDTEIELNEDDDRLFPEIPREIRATRIPGSHERAPFLLKLVALLLVPLNLAAAVLLLWKLL